MTVVVTTAEAAPGPPGPRGPQGTGQNDGPGLLFVNVKDAPYSAKGDCKYANVTCPAGVATLTFADATFVAGDVGKTICLVGGGTLTSYGTTSAGLSTGGAITALPVHALAGDVPVGTVTLYSGAHVQNFTTTGALAGATSIPVESQTPTFAFPSGATVGISANHITTILSVAAGIPTLTLAPPTAVDSVTPFPRNCIWGTDDTVAIQTAIDACIAVGGGTVYLPGSTPSLGQVIYLIAGPLQSTYHGAGLPDNGYTFNTQLCLYDLNFTPISKVALRLVGERGTAYTENSTLRSGTVLQSIVTGTGSRPALLGSPTDISSIPNIHLFFEIENICLRQPPNPSLTYLDLQSTESQSIPDLHIDTIESDGVGIPQQPTNPTGRAIVLPGTGCFASQRIGKISIGACYSGLHVSEHTVCDDLHVRMCVVAIVPNTNAPHAARINYASVEYCTYAVAYATAEAGITDATPNSYLDIGMIDFEDGQDHATPAWMDTVAHFNDPANAFVMNAQVHCEGSGRRVLVNGGAHINWWLNNGTMIPVLIGAGHPITFENSWGSAGQVYVDRAGIVHLEGSISGGASGTIAFNLPRPFRPDHTVTREGLDFAAGKFTQVSIAATGDVTCNLQAGATVVDLEGIAFRSADRAQ